MDNVSCRLAIKFCNWENCVFLQGMKNPAMRQLSPEKVAGLLLVYWTAHHLLKRDERDDEQWRGFEIKVGCLPLTATAIPIPSSLPGFFWCCSSWTSPAFTQNDTGGSFQVEVWYKRCTRCRGENGMTKLKEKQAKLTFPKLHCGLQLSQQISSNFSDALVALAPCGRLALIGPGSPCGPSGRGLCGPGGPVSWGDSHSIGSTFGVWHAKVSMV